jgi:lysophospholipase L1-like esterase
VINEGCGGEWVAMKNSNCAGGVQRLPDVLDQHDPQVVLIMHGANDLRRPSREVSGIVGAIEQMVNDAQRRGVKVMVASLPPQNPEGSRGDAAPRLPEFTRKLDEMAADEGAEFVDLYNIMGTWQGYIGADGLHPTVTGYGKIAEIFRDRIQERFEQPEDAAPSIMFTRR